MSSGRFNPILIIGTIIFLFIGILFLAGWKRRKKNKIKN
jgi:LPXTG-motif cell wall-anchored protein